MRVHTISDIHVDYQENRRWVEEISAFGYRHDILILAGDVTDDLNLLEKIFVILRNRFYQVHYVPGNHDLWVRRNNGHNSLEKIKLIQKTAEDRGISMNPGHYGEVSIIPLYAWYDYSFGKPTEDALKIWADRYACQWPPGCDDRSLTHHFINMNLENMKIKNKYIVSYSHFIPRIDVMPFYIPASKRDIYPFLGTSLLEKQIRALGSILHIYGHSHVNMRTTIENVTYLNNALGYPHEKRISARKLERIDVFLR